LVWPAAAGLLLWLKGVAIAAGIGIAGVVVVAEIRPMVLPSPLVVPRPVSVAPKPSEVRAPMTVTSGAIAASIPAASESSSPAAPAAALSAGPSEPDRAGSAKLIVPTPPTSTPPSQPEIDPLTLEAGMLEQARASLDRDPRASLAQLDVCAARFPSGTLRIERELLAVDALTRVGSTEEARRRAEALLSGAQGSIYEPRVRSLLDKLQKR
jgi:hypothetical protein